MFEGEAFPSFDSSSRGVDSFCMMSFLRRVAQGKDILPSESASFIVVCVTEADTFSLTSFAVTEEDL